MGKLKKAIIVVSAIFIIILIILIVCLNIPKKPNENYLSNEIQSEVSINKDTKLKEVLVRNNYYIAQTCINKFYVFYESIFDTDNKYGLDEDAESKKINQEILYDMLDEEYINTKGITKQNLSEKVEKVKISNLDITNMYVSEKTPNISVYIASGTRRERISGQIANFQIMLKVDSINKTFKVLLQDYTKEKYANIKLGQELEINVPESIEKNSNNIYEFKAISDEEYASDLFNKYKEEMLYNAELAYQNLDEQYKAEKFNTLEAFKEYTKNNYKYNIMAKLDKYQKTSQNGYTQYVCIDQNGKYYIFRETATMKYTAILDTYTIDLPEFIEKYEIASDENKVLMNIQRIFEAINNQDYQYVYNKLDLTFRNSNFKTLAEFETYAKKNFFTKNKIAAGNAEKQGNIYLYDITISDETGLDTTSRKKNFVMQLKEGTDFVMSFGI